MHKRGAAFVISSSNHQNRYRVVHPLTSITILSTNFFLHLLNMSIYSRDCINFHINDFQQPQTMTKV